MANCHHTQPSLFDDTPNQPEAICHVCGTVFVCALRRKGRRFCSQKCQNAFHNARQLALRRRRFCAACAKLRVRRSSHESYLRAISDPAVVEDRREKIRVYRLRPENKARALANKRTEAYRQKERERVARLKLEVLNAYGGAWCAYCGSTDRLCLHHVHGNGGQHRKWLSQHTRKGSERGGRTWYSALKMLGFPQEPRLIVLCEACHHGHRPDAALQHFSKIVALGDSEINFGG
jgi:hypothetical protein